MAGLEHNLVVAFGRNLHHVPQSKDFMLADTGDVDINFSEPGKSFTDELIGTSEPKLSENRYGDTPDGELDGLRRGAFFQTYNDAKWLGDLAEAAKAVVDPANPTVEAMRNGMKRARDNFILSGMFAAVRHGESLENSLAFPAGNIVAANFDGVAGANTGLTLAKLHELSRLLDEGEMDGPRFFAGGSTDKDSLLKTTEVKSADYNSVKALVNGEINSFMGFTFKWFANKRIPKNGSLRRCAAWVKGSWVYRARPIVGGETAKVIERGDKQCRMQAYVEFQQAFMRRHDEGVLAVDCV
jgi:hypothetical protein